MGSLSSGAVQSYLKQAERRLPAKRVGEIYKEFLIQQTADGRSVRYLADIRSRLKRFSDAFLMNIADVETATLDKWLRSLGVSGRTRLNFRTILVTFFNFARQLGYLPKGIPTAADDLPTPQAETEEIEIYTQAELQRSISLTATSTPFRSSALARSPDCVRRRSKGSPGTASAGMNNASKSSENLEDLAAAANPDRAAPS